MKIRTNMSSLRAFRSNSKTNKALEKNLEKLSSGFRINRAGDDAAGLSISEKMRAEITELDRCQSNVSEGLDLARTADGALQEVNDMLRRARGLCIEAKNGTYSDQERAAISDELNQLFSEIDRITASSKYNSIPLFRGDISDHYRDVYNEIFNEVGPNQMERWGQMEFVVDKEFDPAPPAQAATTEFTLNSEINLADKSTLEGKSIKIGSYTYYFTSTPNSAPKDYAAVHISLKNYNTAKEALLSLKGHHTTYSGITIDDIADVSIDEATGKVKLTASLTELTEQVFADGELKDPRDYLSGEPKNGTQIRNPEGDQALGQVDGSGAENNQAVYGTAIGTYSLNFTSLDQTKLDNLTQNSFYVYSSAVGSPVTINFSSLGLALNDTRDTVGQKLANNIHLANNAYTATYNSGTLTVTVDNNGNGAMYAYMQENTKTTSTSGPVNGTPFTGASLGIKANIIQQGTMETPMKVEITVPQSLPSVPFSFQLGGNYYLYYDSSSYDSTAFPSLRTSPSASRIDVKGLSTADIQNRVINNVKNYANGLSGRSVVQNGNTITITAKTNQTLNVTATGATVTATPYKSGTSTTTDRVLNPYGISYFNQEINISFDMGNNPADLVGKGFRIDTKSIEFTNTPGTGLSNSYTDVDISGCANMQDVITAVNSKLSPTYSATLTGNQMTISTKRSTYPSSTAVIVTDGAGGVIADGAPVQFAGGTTTGYSQTTIDFSSINESNLDSLLGKGFRINCATCAGEYINVFFCWENDGSMPEQFQRLDESTGEMRTIHNIPVELSKVTSGDKIVESIVNQVRPSLTHYTDVMIGDPPTTLIAKEKRLGDVRDAGDKLYLGKVQTGMETNFTYTVEKVRAPDLPADGSVKLYTSDVLIYAGSEPVPQYIPIHLPYIDLEWLRLNPPEVVDLNADDQDAADWLARVDRANIAISDARGTIGADYNRLEHAYEALAVSDEQLTDAESRIRDADIAALMMDHVKLQILSQSQQTMMAQANSQPQQVLQLLA